ncbi:hypothetical protein Droror1_Dr00020423 [Drosera rotundifolia]
MMEVCLVDVGVGGWSLVGEVQVVVVWVEAVRDFDDGVRLRRAIVGFLEKLDSRWLLADFGSEWIGVSW